MPVRGNKRKRLESVAHMLAMENIGDIEHYNIKPESNFKLSCSGGSILDATLSPEKSLGLYFSTILFHIMCNNFFNKH